MAGRLEEGEPLAAYLKRRRGMNAPVLYSGEMVPFADLDRMAEAFAKAKLFGAKTKEEVLSLMLVAQAEGMHPASAARDYDIIQGKGSKKSEAMMRDFLRAGGKVEWHKLDRRRPALQIRTRNPTGQRTSIQREC
jgi:hypothetical protein